MVRPSYDLDARIRVLTVRRRAPAPPRDLTPPCHYIVLLTYRGDSELSLSQERVKCAVFDGFHVMVRPSYDLHARISWC